MSSMSLDVFRAHGGRLEAACALFPHAHRPWIDLSTGISPWSYPYGELAESAFTRLPDAEALVALETAAAGSFGVVDAARVVATPGSDLALRCIAALFTGRQVAVVRPGYSGHVLAWGGASLTLISAEELESAAKHHDVIVLANPNNPDGRYIERERLQDLARRLALHSGTLVVDEAYADIAPGHSLCSELSGDGADSIIILRSFGKFFGLAGVRLGFVVAPPVHACALRRTLGDWPVSGPALAIGLAAYRDRKWQAMQLFRLEAAAARLDAILASAGLSIEGGTPLFRLVRVPNAEALFRRLASRGILTRPFKDDSTLLRIGLPAEESHWERLASALDWRALQ